MSNSFDIKLNNISVIVTGVMGYLILFLKKRHYGMLANETNSLQETT